MHSGCQVFILQERDLFRISLFFCAICCLLGVAWLWSDQLLQLPYAFFRFRTAMVDLTGVMAIGVMSVAMLLSIRPVALEPMLGGLDKMYRLHKWLGISGAVVSLLHLLAIKAPAWLPAVVVGARPARTPRALHPNAFVQFLQEQRGLAEEVAGVTLALLLVLIVAALIKQFPYRYFAVSHRLLAVVYLVLVMHSVVLLPLTYWRAPIGLLLAPLMLVGSLSAVRSILRRIGVHRRAVAEIARLERHADNRVLSVEIKFRDRWNGHAAGQFAFLTFDGREGPHPFTIASSWHGDGAMTFLIKDLGGYTHGLPDALRVGDLVKVEGPYGQFQFGTGARRQIWIGGGIGITPFMARMEAITGTPDGRNIDLFYTTREPDVAFIDEVRGDAARANVDFHLLVESRDGRLNATAVCEAVPEWRTADIWFCGPRAFGGALRREFRARGLHARAFHQELFDMR